MKVSCLILTFNEEANLESCLKALSWCDDIVVLDSGSTDRTEKIALDHGARLIFRSFDNFANQRNFGLDKGKFRHDWVLHLDADEIVTTQFVLRLNQLRPTPSIRAYKMPSKIILMGRWLRYSGMYPAYQVRLGHRDHLRFKQVGHGQREDLEPAKIDLFDEPYLHFCFSHGLVNWLEKHVKYAADEAKLISERTKHDRNVRDIFALNGTDRRRAFKALTDLTPGFLRPFARVFYVLVLRRGFLDGWPGFIYAFMLSIYEGMITIILYEKSSSENRKPENIE